AAAVVYERDGRALEVAADTAAVCAELRDDLVVPVVRFRHLSLLVCSPVSGASVLPDGRFVDGAIDDDPRSWENGHASRLPLGACDGGVTAEFSDTRRGGRAARVDWAATNCVFKKADARSSAAAPSSRTAAKPWNTCGTPEVTSRVIGTSAVAARAASVRASL